MQMPSLKGMADLTVYITHFYNGFVYLGPNVDGFSMIRVRRLSLARL